MDLSNIDLLQLMTQYMQQDDTVQAFCGSLNPQIRQATNEISLILIYANIDAASEKLLDELAWQFHLDYYDSTADISVKKNLIKSAILIHKNKGTPFAVKKLIIDVFGYGELLEWFQYDGEPYTFRVAVDHEVGNPDNVQKFIKVIESVKNIRSHLETMEFIINEYLIFQENIYKRDMQRLTILGATWHLGTTPFASVSGEVQVK